jgi:hypothetical protein
LLATIPDGKLPTNQKPEGQEEENLIYVTLTILVLLCVISPIHNDTRNIKKTANYTGQFASEWQRKYFTQFLARRLT